VPRGEGQPGDRGRDRDTGGSGRGEPGRGRQPARRDEPGRGRGRAAPGPRGPERAERPDRPGRAERPERFEKEEAGPKRWGGLARRGAGRLTSERASDAWRAAARDRQGSEDEPRGDAGEPAWQPEGWIDEGELRDEAEGAVGRGGAAGERGRGPQRAPGQGRRAPGGSGRGPQGASSRSRRQAADDWDDDRDEGHGGGGAEASGKDLRAALGAARGARAEARLREASDAFRRERFEDARRLLRPLAEQAPGVAVVRELYGLTLYRLGRWAQAMRELEAYRTLTGSSDQLPVLADTYRALGRYTDVEELWDELRAASPAAELVAEGRIVAAGALADQGKLDEAIGLLSAGVRPTKRARLHHLRMAYALADLYERAGDLPRARDLFRRVADSEPDFVDVQARIHALR
jgi:hypothetical protein